MAETISVRVRAFAILREALGSGELVVTLPAGADVAALLAQLEREHPDARLAGRRFTTAVNRTYAPPEQLLADGDEVALIPPVSGGSARLFEVVDSPISIDEVANRLSAPENGAITLFVGTVRGLTEKPAGDVVTDYLEYEAYAEMAEPVLESIAGEAVERWPAIHAVSIVHRIGRMEIGEVSIVIAVAAGHREDTFDACHYIIDRVKQIAPIWKREVGPDGSSWVEGPGQ
jgi:molybdopterin synthase catalytic subunit